MGGLAEEAGEKTMKMKRRHAGFSRNAFQGQIPSQVAMNESDGALQPAADLLPGHRSYRGNPRHAHPHVMMQRRKAPRHRRDRLVESEGIVHSLVGAGQLAPKQGVELKALGKLQSRRLHRRIEQRVARSDGRMVRLLDESVQKKDAE